MAKFKKYSKSILCMVSASVFFIMALFYPLENFMANVSAGSVTTKTLTFNINETSLTQDSSNVMINPVTVDVSDEVADMRKTFYYMYWSPSLIVDTSADIFAYRIHVKCDSISSNTFDNVVEKRLAVGTIGDFVSGNPLIGSDIWSGSSYYFWYENNYEANQWVYLGLYAHLFDLETTTNDTSYLFPKVVLKSSYTVTITPYTEDDLLDEVYTKLTEIYSNDVSMLSYLKNIYNSVDTVETKLQSLVTSLEAVDSNTDEIEGLLRTCNSYLSSIKTELEEQTTWLEKIYDAIVEFLGLEGEEEMEDVEQDDMDNMLQVEGELLGGASSSDLENNLTVTIDSYSSSFIWDTINSLVTSNSVVFGGFISILSLGIVALILGR